MPACACRYVFVEYGPMELDINLRVRVHELERAIQERVGALSTMLAVTAPSDMAHGVSEAPVMLQCPQIAVGNLGRLPA